MCIYRAISVNKCDAQLVGLQVDHLLCLASLRDSVMRLDVVMKFIIVRLLKMSC